MIRVASVGECMIELSGAGEPGLWRMGYAGDTFNALWCLRALLDAKCEASFVSAFGDDPFSAEQIGFFERHGIGIAASPRLPAARPGLYAITLTGAERAFTYWRGDSAARRLADDPDALRKSLAGRRLVYFSGITLAILSPAARETLAAAVVEARDNGSLIAFDPNYRPRLWSGPDEARDVIGRFVALADMALPTFEDENLLWGDADPARTVDRLRAAGVREGVVKNGAKDAMSFSGVGIEAVAALSVSDAVDTTGAGDAFNGGYLAARLLGLELQKAARRAHWVAAATVRVRGALAPMEALREAYAVDASSAKVSAAPHLPAGIPARRQQSPE